MEELKEIKLGEDSYSYKINEYGNTVIYDDDKQWPIFTMSHAMTDNDVITFLYGYRHGLEIGIKLGRSRLQTELKLALEY